MKAVYFFCTDPDKDRVAPAVYDACRQVHDLKPTEIRCDGIPVLRTTDAQGNEYYFAHTDDVVSHRFAHYLPLLSGPFADCRFAGIVNWHEGGNAPDRIYCAHTNGDVPSGVFGAADPPALTAILRVMDRTRVAAGLGDWSVTPEATHFAGTQYGTEAEVLLGCPVPVFDIEIGSEPGSWADPVAVEALARALTEVFSAIDDNEKPVLYVGGIHFEPSLREAVVPPGSGWQVGHVLPNQWLWPDAYNSPAGEVKLLAAARSTRGGVSAVIFHEGVKGPVKESVRAAAAALGLPVAKHRKLREGFAALTG